MQPGKTHAFHDYRRLAEMSGARHRRLFLEDAYPPGCDASSHFRVCGHAAADVPALLGALKQLGL
jgi:hypothetical protein